MEYLLQTLAISIVLPTLLFVYLSLRRQRPRLPSPPGNAGLPLIGETLSYLYHVFRNDAPSFAAPRIQKYGPIFSTSILGNMTVMSNSAAFHRLLFTHENTLLRIHFPSSVIGVLGDGSVLAKSGNEGKRLRSAMMTFLVPSALRKYVDRVDAIALKHLEEDWDRKDVVSAYALAKQFTFAVVCDLFVSVTDKKQEADLLAPFRIVMAGLFTLPVHLPWTRYGKAMKAGKLLRERFRVLADRRRMEEEKEGSNYKDILSCLLHYKDEDGKSLRDDEIADNILTMLMGGHHTTSSFLTLLLKNLADYKWCYDEVLKEHLAIKAAKKPGEPLNWGDLQRMQYSWSTMQETLRLQPVALGGFRKGMQDIEYDGYTIPKGWTLYWSANTHVESQYFPNPDKFDPTRFSSPPIPYTFVPFGGGPRMCPGNEFTKMLSLIFLHHVITRYDFTLLHPHEPFYIDAIPVPCHGLPIKLSPSTFHTEIVSK